MAVRSWFRLTGLFNTASTGLSGPGLFPCPVIMRIGCRGANCLILAASSLPFMNGSSKSVITRSNWPLVNKANASAPLLASTTVCSSLESNRPMDSRTNRSSSTSNMRFRRMLSSPIVPRPAELPCSPEEWSRPVAFPGRKFTLFIYSSSQEHYGCHLEIANSPCGFCPKTGQYWGQQVPEGWVWLGEGAGSGLGQVFVGPTAGGNPGLDWLSAACISPGWLHLSPDRSGPARRRMRETLATE